MTRSKHHFTPSLLAPHVVVLGSANLDHVFTVQHFPSPGETRMANDYQAFAGGKGANQAVAAAKLGANVFFAGCVGHDTAGSFLLKSLHDEGVNTEWCAQLSTRPTGLAFICVDRSGENFITLNSGANEHMNLERVQALQPLIRQCDVLLVQMETPLAGVYEAIDVASKAGARVILNPAPAQSIADDWFGKLYLITPNQSEAQILTGVVVIDPSSAAQAAKVLHDKGVENVIITMGASGVWLSKNKIGVFMPSFKVSPIDTTAAGDTFNGALACALLKHSDLSQAVDYAQAAAALSTTKPGAQSSIPTTTEVAQFLAQRPNQLLSVHSS